MYRLGNLLRRARGAVAPRALGALSGLLLATACAAAAIPWTANQGIEFSIGNGSGTASNQSVGVADAVAIDAAHKKFYVTDRQNHRVLRFAYPATSNQPVAEAVFGQPDFTSSSANRGGTTPTASSLNVPYGLAVAANGDLWVADHDNNRLLKFSTAYSATGDTAASRVLGQSGFTAAAGASAADRLQAPSGLSIDSSDNLWVADSSNNRVLRFASVSSAADGAAATQVLGQPDFGSNGFMPGTTTANRFYGPYAVCVSGTTLWVADSSNNRVLRYDNATTRALFASADGVLGQANLTSGTANRGGTAAANTLSFPGGVAADDSGTLYVSDSFNTRVLLFTNAAAKTAGAAADNVLGAATTTGAGNLYTSWNIAYDSTYHRLLVGRASGAAVNQYFNAYATTTALATSNNPAAVGATVTFTATVSTTGGGATATGTVQFKDGSTVLGTGTLNASGVATFATASLTEGDHSISAAYLEGAAHKASVSTSITQVVGRYTPTIALVPSSSPSSASDALVLTVTLTPPAMTATIPSGTVQFSVDGTSRATVTLSSGAAAWTVSDLTAGPHTLTATYNGDTRFRSVTTTLSQTVNPVGKRTFNTVANVERDIKGTEEIIFNGPDQGSQVYVGNYDGYDFWCAFLFEFPTQTIPIDKAQFKVRISGKSATPPTFTIELHGSVDDNWSDTTSPRTAPATMLPAIIATATADSAGLNEWLTFDVTEFVRTQIAADKKATLILTTQPVPAGALVGFHSRETGDSGPVLEITEAMSFTKWASANFTAAELANSAISGATSDPDGAGISNLMRYALDLPARGPVATPLSTTFNTAANPMTGTLAFPIRASAGNLSYEVQTSPDLVTWTTAGTYTANGTKRTALASVSVTTGSTRFFLRLRVTQLP